LRSIIIINLLLGLPLLARAAENSGLVAASQWIDREIYDKSGRQIGETDDLVIKRSGKIKKVTIDVGGFLGIIGDKLVAVSLRELQNLMLDGNGRMVLDTTEQQLQKRSEFDYYQQGLLPDYYYRPGGYYKYNYAYRYFPPPYPRTGPYYGPQSSYHRTEPYSADEPHDWAWSPARYLASNLTDRPVVSASGAFLGRVADLLIDVQKGEVKKIILEAAEIRGDDPLVAIPYEPPGFTVYGVVCDLSQEEIRKMPAYSDAD
jgi:sporulation protein YlmC with PRC-barrel domain